MALEAQNNPFTSVLMVEAADPEAIGDADPSAGQRRLVVGTDHILYLLSDSGVKTAVGGSGIANPLATDSLWDAAGDLVQGSGANTAAKLSAGTAGKVLTSNGAAAALTWETPASAGAMATDVLWDAAGDLAQGTGANTGAKLTAGTAGHVLTSNGAAAAVSWQAPAAASPTFAGVWAVKTATFPSLANTTLTTLQFNGTDVYDTNTYHDPAGANPERLTVPSGKDGYYEATIIVSFASNATGRRRVCVAKNGSTLLCASMQAVNGQDSQMMITFPPISLVATDYLTAQASQDSGGALSTNDQQFSMQRLGV